MDKIIYNQELSVSDVYQMQVDLQDLIALVEHTNEILTVKLEKGNLVFAGLIKTMIINNNISMKSMMASLKLVNQVLYDYLKETNCGREV